MAASNPSIPVLSVFLIVSIVIVSIVPKPTTAADTDISAKFQTLREQLTSLNDASLPTNAENGEETEVIKCRPVYRRQKRSASNDDSGEHNTDFEDDDSASDVDLKDAVEELERERQIMVQLGSELNHFNGGLQEAAKIKNGEAEIFEELGDVKADIEKLRQEMAELKKLHSKENEKELSNEASHGEDAMKTTVHWLKATVAELQSTMKEFDDALNVTLLIQRKDEDERSTAVLEKSILDARKELEEEKAKRLQDTETVSELKEELQRVTSMQGETGKDMRTMQEKVEHLESIVESLRGLLAEQHPHVLGNNHDSITTTSTIVHEASPASASVITDGQKAEQQEMSNGVENTTEPILVTPSPMETHTVLPPPPLTPLSDEELKAYFSKPRPSKHMHHHRHLKHEISLMQTVLEGLYDRQIMSDATVERLDDRVKELSIMILDVDDEDRLSNDTDAQDGQSYQRTTLVSLADRVDALEQRFSHHETANASSEGTFSTSAAAELEQAIKALRVTTLTVSENLESVESEMDSKFRQHRKEISKLEFNAAQIASSVEVLRQDQNEVRKVSDSLVAAENLLKKRMDADHLRLLSVSNQVLNMTLRSCQDDNRETMQDLKIARVETAIEQIKNKVDKHAGKFDEVETTMRNKVGSKQFAGVVTDTRGLAVKMEYLYRDILSNLGNIVDDLNNRTMPMLRALPHDCEAISSRYPGTQLVDGDYAIRPGNMSRPVLAWCDFASNDANNTQEESNDDEAWTVIQRRTTGSVQFFRDWQDYKFGFGDVKGDYWIGNEALHYLTSSPDSGNYTLRFELRDVDGNFFIADYSEFRVGPESDGFRLSTGGYSGNATDSLGFHHGMKFSTPDVDNDASSTHCAHYYQGGWWYSHCQYVNVNGRFDTGRTWYDAEEHEWIQIAESVMKIRQKPSLDSTSVYPKATTKSIPETSSTTEMFMKKEQPSKIVETLIQSSAPGGDEPESALDRASEILRDISSDDSEDDTSNAAAR